MATTIRYQFRQYFSVPVQAAYDWCTYFTPGDRLLMGHRDSERTVTRITEGTLLLKDTLHAAGATVEKHKLVHLYPADFAWTSTHMTGPNRFSQFLYRISPDGNGGSFLDFTASHLEYDCTEDPKTLAARLCGDDFRTWNLLAKALEEDLAGK